MPSTSGSRRRCPSGQTCSSRPASRCPSVPARGGLAVGVPGEVRGLAELIKRFGKRSFADCVRPAEQLAVKGFAATPRLALAVEKNGSASQHDHGSRRHQGRARGHAAVQGAAASRGSGHAPGAGARPCASCAQRGPEAFYTGPIALAIVKAVKDAGGVMLPEDLRRYTVIERKPIEIGYRGCGCSSMPPPSSGGMVLAEALGVLSAWRQPAQAGTAARTAVERLLPRAWPRR